MSYIYILSTSKTISNSSCDIIQTVQSVIQPTSSISSGCKPSENGWIVSLCVSAIRKANKQMKMEEDNKKQMRRVRGIREEEKRNTQNYGKQLEE
jgi:hypothetical protein